MLKKQSLQLLTYSINQILPAAGNGIGIRPCQKALDFSPHLVVRGLSSMFIKARPLPGGDVPGLEGYFFFFRQQVPNVGIAFQKWYFKMHDQNIKIYYMWSWSCTKVELWYLTPRGIQILQLFTPVYLLLLSMA